MKRVVVLGAPGAGKTTFSLKLAEKTGLPVIHLDRVFFSKEYDSHGQEWYDKIDELTRGKKWIADGNYSSSFKLRYERADTIFLLDYSRARHMSGIVRRRIKYHKKHRPEMPDDWQERFGREFLGFAWTFSARYKHRITDPLAEYQDKLVVFKKPRDAEKYLQSL